MQLTKDTKATAWMHGNFCSMKFSWLQLSLEASYLTCVILTRDTTYINPLLCQMANKRVLLSVPFIDGLITSLCLGL